MRHLSSTSDYLCSLTLLPLSSAWCDIIHVWQKINCKRDCITTQSTNNKAHCQYSSLIGSIHEELTIITGRNEVLAKVIFLQLFVILFTGGGVPGPGGCTWSGGVPGPGGGTWSRGCTWSGGGVPGPGGVYLVPGGVPGPGGYLVPGGVYLVPGGVPGPGGRYLVPGGCTWSWGGVPGPGGEGVPGPGGYLVRGGVPGPGGCTWSGTPPSWMQTPEYGQRSAGTHPTGMHSCTETLIVSV